MFLLEYEGKELLREYGIKTPRNILVHRKNLDNPPTPPFDPPYVIKAQILGGGRGKLGGIKIIKDINKYRSIIADLFNWRVDGAPPDYLLVEEYVPHEKEYYLGIILSRADREFLILASRFGGVEIEDLAKMPGSLIKININPLIGPSNYQYRLISSFLLGEYKDYIEDLIHKLYRLFVEKDLLLLEINPLVIINEEPIALDARIVVDENAIVRIDLDKFYEYSVKKTGGEKVAREYRFSYVPLRGDVAVIGNGAGLVMATMDLIQYYGGKVACFLDIGGGARAQVLEKALEIVSHELKPKSILINIFGGITRCDEVARGIVSALNKIGVKSKIVVRLIGTNEDLGIEILRRAGINVYKEMSTAAMEAVKT